MPVCVLLWSLTASASLNKIIARVCVCVCITYLVMGAVHVLLAAEATVESPRMVMIVQGPLLSEASD